MGKTDARLHDRAQIPHGEMSNNWDEAFGQTWCVITPEGARLSMKFKSYELAREWAMNEYPGNTEFGLVKM